MSTPPIDRTICSISRKTFESFSFSLCLVTNNFQMCFFSRFLGSKARIALRGSRDGARWCQMLPDGASWFQMVPDGPRCCQPRCRRQVLPDASRCCQVLPDAAGSRLQGAWLMAHGQGGLARSPGPGGAPGPNPGRAGPPWP